MKDKKKTPDYGWFSFCSNMTRKRFEDEHGIVEYRQSGSFIYLTSHNTEVEVTTVSKNPNDHGTGFHDIKFVGEVVRFLRYN